jgi:hypothetical protein
LRLHSTLTWLAARPPRGLRIDGREHQLDLLDRLPGHRGRRARLDGPEPDLRSRRSVPAHRHTQRYLHRAQLEPQPLTLGAGQRLVQFRDNPGISTPTGGLATVGPCEAGSG